MRLSRKRFWHGDVDTDKHSAYTTLHTVLETVLRLLAPFVPFTAEELYRGLQAHADPGVSVHLQDYPVADGKLVDADLERRMAAAQEAVRLGRSARQASGVKTRQPLGRLCLYSPQGLAGELTDDPVIGGYIRSELNVKTLETAAELGTLASQTAKANFRALGPRFGKDVPRWAEAIASLEAAAITRLGTTGSVEIQCDGRTEEFGGDEIQVKLVGKGSYAVSGSTNLVTAIDTTIDDALRAEGIAREIINRVQNLRKKSGLAVSDRIVLDVKGPQQVLAAVTAHEERIRTETLANGIAAAGELPYKETFVIEGDEVGVALDRA